MSDLKNLWQDGYDTAKKEAADTIEQIRADGKMKDKRIDWTVDDNVKKAITIEQFEKRHDKIAGVVLELLKLFKPPEDKT